MPRSRQFAALLGLTLAAGALTPGLAAAAQTVKIDLEENGDGAMIIATSADTVHAGQITFAVKNKSKNVEHEFLVARLNTAVDALPYNDSRGKLKESAMKDVTELGDLRAGDSGKLTLDLSPGKYLLFCNLPGHFKAGMYHVLTVKK